MQTVKAFISYSHQDTNFAALLATSLVHYGIHPWKDTHQIRTGERFDSRIFNAINNSDILLSLLSASALASDWCNRELAHALARCSTSGSPRVFPLLISSCTLPENVKHLSFADFRTQFEAPLRKLVADIRQEDIDQPPYQPSCVASTPYRDTRENEAIRIYNLGIVAYQRGDVRQAVEHFEKASQIDPANYDSTYNAAVAIYDLAQRASGDDPVHLVVERYEEVLRIRPDDVDAMVNLGVLYNTEQISGKPERAKELFERAIQLAPDYALAWLNLGHYYGLVGGARKLEEAAKPLKEGRADSVNVSFNPQYLQGAIYCYEKAFELEPNFRRMFPATEHSVNLFCAFLKSQDLPAHLPKVR